MKKKTIPALVLAVMLSVFGIFALSGCGSEEEADTADLENVEVMTGNGNMIGVLENDVASFKGVPYAKSPTGELRWKRAEAPDPSTEDVDATEYGKAALQTVWHSEEASFNEQSEDCLTLNIWTKSANDADAKKPVMVFVHGGAYGWGGSSDPIYDGQNFAEANGDDVILVTVNYRINMLGFIDFSSVPGGEEYADAPWLGLYDNIRALEWVQENIEAFGGDPGNVTIFGESAGGGIVSLLPLMDEAQGLFQKVIAESGSVYLTSSKEDCQLLTELIMEKTGAENMDDLIALSEDEIKDLVTYTLDYEDEELGIYGGVYNSPMRDGTVLPETVQELCDAYAQSPASDIIYMTGTNANEYNYWLGEMTGKDEPGALPTDEDYEYFYYSYEDLLDGIIAEDETGDMKTFKKLLKQRGIKEKIWQSVEYINETYFRIPAITEAENHAGATYMYYWKHPSSIDDYGACHAVELSYVFNNLQDTAFTGDNPDEELAKKVQQAWVSFAKTGVPTVEGEPEWPEYNKDTRATMIINDTSENEHWTVENDPLGEERAIFQKRLAAE